MRRCCGAVLLLCASAPLAAAAPTFIAECDAADWSAECLRKALQLDGAVAVARVPGLASAREQALLSVARCTASSPNGASELVLADGTSRRSLGTRTLHGVAEPLLGCDTDDAAAALRAVVDQFARRLLRALQPLQRGPSALLAEHGRSYASLEALADAGEQLEHFHAYWPAPVQPSSAPHAVEKAEAVPLHTDAGLFIAIVPALYAASAAQAPGGSRAPLVAIANPEADAVHEGFCVQRWDGATMKVDPASEAGALVFVVGEGWSQWLNPQLSTPLRAAPHRMTMPHRLGATQPQWTRVWYGRMYLPPADAVLHPGGRPFADWRKFYSAHPPPLNRTAASVVPTSPVATSAATAADGGSTGGLTLVVDAAAERSLPVGCGGGRRILSSAATCAGNEIFCWHKCIEVSSLECGTAAVCWSADESSIWREGDAHCAHCQPTCLSPPSPPSAPLVPRPPPYVEPFCTGPGTDMHMSGFVWGGGAVECLNFLFAGWKLDSPLKYYSVRPAYSTPAPPTR